MLKFHTVKALYPLALAEGEGVGTAYEYVAKRLALSKWLQSIPKPSTMVIAGLPQKYGSSLDSFLLAAELNAKLWVIDDRPAALEKARLALEAVQAAGHLQGLEPEFFPVASLGQFELDDSVDLAISSEVLQRLTPDQRPGYAASVNEAAHHTVMFSPNKANESHVGISGLDGLHLEEIMSLWPNAAATGFIDMPPFPPGITRTEDQREQATTGTAEAIAMWGLNLYARAEVWFPAGIRKRYGHIVYAFGSGV